MEGTTIVFDDHDLTEPDAVNSWDQSPLATLGTHHLRRRSAWPFPDFQVISQRQFEHTSEQCGSHSTDADHSLPPAELYALDEDLELLPSPACVDHLEAADCEFAGPAGPLADQTTVAPEPASDNHSPSAPRPPSCAGTPAPSLASQLRRHSETLHKLSKRAAVGDPAAIAGIQDILNDNSELWHYFGDVERATEAMLIEFLSGPPEVKESVRRTTRELKSSLLTPDSSPLESLAVGRVVACWLFVNFVDRWSGYAIKESGRTSGVGKVLESSEKRLQTAIKSLKLVRGMKGYFGNRAGSQPQVSTVDSSWAMSWLIAIHKTEEEEQTMRIARKRHHEEEQTGSRIRLLPSSAMAISREAD